MSLLDLHADALIQAGRDTAQRQTEKPAAPSKFNAWKLATSVARGLTTAAAEVAGTGAEIMGMVGEVYGAYPELMGPAGLSAEQQRQADKQRQKLLTQGIDPTNPVAESLRAAGDAYKPDPVSSHWAEKVLFGFSRGAGKIVGGAMVGGPAGVLAAGAEEAVTQTEELRKQGVPFGPRVAAGVVQGAGLALAALPAAGATLGKTAALYAAGGPGGFMAQQALTREILRDTSPDIAAQFDPFDPVGLTVAALLPAGFAVHGLRKQALRVDLLREVQAQAPMREAPPADVVDAALTANLTAARATTSVGRLDDTADGAAHDAALTRAEQQFAAGERVSVADVAPAARVEAETPQAYHQWAAQVTEAADDMRRLVAELEPKARPDAQAAKAADAEGPAAPRGPGIADEGAKPQGRPAPADEAAGVTPQAMKAQAAEQMAVAARLAEIQAQYPDLMVKMDGMDAPMKMADFVAAAKAEADELGADAPLMQVAAECFLLNGA